MGVSGRGRTKDFEASVRLGSNEIWLIAPGTREQRTLADSTFLVKDLEEVVSELKRRGVRFDRAKKAILETRVEGTIAYEPFRAFAFFKDSEGNLLKAGQNIPAPLGGATAPRPRLTATNSSSPGRRPRRPVRSGPP